LPRHVGASTSIWAVPASSIASRWRPADSSGRGVQILILTADTYSKYINERDKSVRTLFGDGAAATLVCSPEDGETGTLGPFIFGTDGEGPAT
jgi:3-oxoacyl-[acyl-carrier-protein] synthase III